MNHSLRAWLMLGAPVLAILAVTLIQPLMGEHALAAAVTLLAVLMITL
jgi:hypothetical protein